MKIRCFLQTRYSEVLFNKTLSLVFVLKHVTEPFKHLAECLKSLTTGLCYNTTHAVPINHGKLITFEQSFRYFFLKKIKCHQNNFFFQPLPSS